MTATSSEPRLRVAFLVKTVPMMSWVADQASALTGRGHSILPLAMRADAESVTGQAPAAGVQAPRLLGAGSAVGVAKEALAALAADPRAAAGALGRLHRGSGKLAWRMALAAIANGSQLLHAHFGNFAASVLPAAAISDLPLVVSFYGWDASAAPLSSPGMYNDLFRRARAVISLSAEMTGTLAELGCPLEKIHVVHISVDGKAIRQQARVAAAAAGDGGSHGDSLRVLAVGRLVEKKGLDDALQAMALASARGIDITFRIIGDGPLRGALEEQARHLGVAARVIFTGARTREEVFAAMATSDVFFLPSKVAASGDREGTPTVLIEAGALGIPCLATRHAGTPEVVLDGETGLLTGEREVEAMAAALKRLAQQPGLCRQLGEAARRRMDAEFEMSGQCTRLEKIYASCLAAAEH